MAFLLLVEGFGHRTSQSGDIPDLCHPVKDYTTQKVRLRFPERPISLG